MYKFVLSLLSLLMLALLVIAFPVKAKSSITNKVTESPNWLMTLPFTQCQDSVYLCGVGQGESLPEAKTAARGDISKQLSAQVASKTEINTTLENGKVTRKANTKLVETSQVTLTGSIIQLAGEQIDDVWFVAIAYDKRAAENKLTSWLAKAPCEHGINNFLKQTPLLATGLSALACQPKLHLTKPAGDKSNSQWSLSHSKGSLLLSKNHYESLFTSTTSDAFTLKTSQTRLTPSQYYHVTVLTQQSGYLTLLQILESGQISVWLENKKVTTNDRVVFPDLRKYEGLTSEVPAGKSRTFDMNVALLCQQPIDTSRFEKVSMQHLTNQQSQLNPLLKVMEQCEFTTQRINTKR